ncbi:Activating signal cointegrator 1 [Chlorella vulgaris]
MAGRQGNQAWLRQQLQKTLQWDAEAAEAVVEAIVQATAAADSQAAVEELVVAYMGGNPSARNLVQQFVGVPAPHKQKEGASGSGGRQRPADTAAPQPPILDMGPNIRTTVKPARKKAAGGGGSGSASQQPLSGVKALAKSTVNCLSCGKIYDCRTLAGEALRFLESGGICSFCGKHVELRYADGSTNAADIAAAGAAAGLPGGGALAEGKEMPGPTGARPTGQQQQGGKGGAAGPAALAYNESAAEAVALRDRLVQFDREAAKRTTVLDDQSDFFEIDANAWLTDEERAVLKQREREAQEAEEARRRHVTVSIDLLGRKVLLDSDPATGQGGEGDAAALDAALEAARAAAAIRAAAAATAAEGPQGGGAAAPTALMAVEDRLRDLRITASPSMASRNFVFLPQKQQQQQQQQQQQPRQQVPSAGGPGASSASAGQQEPSSSSSSSRPQRQQQQKPKQRQNAATPGFSRLQHDDPFSLLPDDPFELGGVSAAITAGG